MYSVDPKRLPHLYLWMGLLGGPLNPASYPTFIAYCWYVDWLKSIVDAMDFPDQTGKSS
jgi:hypothetical protein